MKEVAILSKNILIENDLEKKLQMLGYEVFCSTRMLEKLLLQQGGEYLTTFKTIIISETISDDELTLLLENIEKDIYVYRVDSDIPSDQELEKWQEKYPIRWLSKESSLKELRERFCEDQLLERTYAQNEKAPEMLSIKKAEEDFMLFTGCLSKNEKELFDTLYAADGQIVARSTLCNLLWNKCTSSNMAQLSQLIRRLREKMKNYEISSDSLQTHWKNGYSFSKGIFIEKYSGD